MKDDEDDIWQCPNCGEFWGIEEFDAQRCGSCGYPDYDEDFDMDDE
jgi:ribosomal protein S27AE